MAGGVVCPHNGEDWKQDGSPGQGCWRQDGGEVGGVSIFLTFAGPPSAPDLCQGVAPRLELDQPLWAIRRPCSIKVRPWGQPPEAGTDDPCPLSEHRPGGLIRLREASRRIWVDREAVRGLLGGFAHGVWGLWWPHGGPSQGCLRGPLPIFAPRSRWPRACLSCLLPLPRPPSRGLVEAGMDRTES